jgi:NitT/TauT family transport system substrate-binding protein
MHEDRSDFSASTFSGERRVSRRAVIRTVGAGVMFGGLVARGAWADSSMPGMVMPSEPFPDLGPIPPKPANLKPVTLAWNESAICTAAVPAALHQGFFQKYGLDVNFVNFAGSTDQLLEAISTGKADGATGMALRWLKPLQEGFDVKLAAGLHGGCLRLLATPTGGIKTIADLKGKAIGTSDLGSPDKNFFSIRLAQLGIDPTADVTWKVFPPDLLGAALKRGDVQAISGGDPLIWLQRKNLKLTQIATNMDGPYAHRTCCVVGLRGSLLREQPYVANTLTRAILEGGRFVADHPDQAAQIFASYAPKVPVPDLVAMLHEHAHHMQQIGAPFQQQVAEYAADLKTVGVFSSSVDPARFAAKVTVDPFTVT